MLSLDQRAKGDGSERYREGRGGGRLLLSCFTMHSYLSDHSWAKPIRALLWIKWLPIMDCNSQWVGIATFGMHICLCHHNVIQLQSIIAQSGLGVGRWTQVWSNYPWKKKERKITPPPGFNSVQFHELTLIDSGLPLSSWRQSITSAACVECNTATS